MLKYFPSALCALALSACTPAASIWVQNNDTGAPSVNSPETGEPDTTSPPDTSTDGTNAGDEDADGFTVTQGDCDDSDPAINPDAIDDSCDQIDQDCDGEDGNDIAADTSRSSGENSCGDIDVDGDGWFVDATTGIGLDCDDGDPEVNPGHVEVCDNGLNDDCDAEVDEADCDNGETDADHDGVSVEDGDCDDADPSVTSESTFYLDADGDDYGDDLIAVSSCGADDGYVSAGGDCDDSDATSYPGADELCDGLDNDCDTVVDNDVVDEVWYEDADGDGYGDPVVTLDACAQPDGYVTDATDCDDAQAEVNPGMVETAYDGVDQDCSGADLTDVDCDLVAGTEAGGTDCDDNNVAVSPALPELCDNEVDDNCDGQVDENCSVDTAEPIDTGTPIDTGSPVVDTGTPAPVFDGTVEFVFTDVDGTVTAMKIYVFDESSSDFGNWMTDASGADTSANSIMTLTSAGGSVTWGGADYAVSEGDSLKVQGVQGGTYLVYGSTPDVHSGLTANGHACVPTGHDTTGDGIFDGGDYVCIAAAADPVVDTGTPADTDSPAPADTGTPADTDVPVDTGDTAAPVVMYYNDRDHDGYGDPGSSSASPLAGYVSSELGEDCNDYNSAINPGAADTSVDHVDQDCDGVDGS